MLGKKHSRNSANTRVTGWPVLPDYTSSNQETPKKVPTERLLSVPCTHTTHSHYEATYNSLLGQDNTQVFLQKPSTGLLKLLYRSNREINSLPCFIKKNTEFVLLKL